MVNIKQKHLSARLCHPRTSHAHLNSPGVTLSRSQRCELVPPSRCNSFTKPGTVYLSRRRFSYFILFAYPQGKHKPGKGATNRVVKHTETAETRCGSVAVEITHCLKSSGPIDTKLGNVQRSTYKLQIPTESMNIGSRIIRKRRVKYVPTGLLLFVDLGAMLLYWPHKDG
jgi:hypothetical protein